MISVMTGFWICVFVVGAFYLYAAYRAFDDWWNGHT